MPTEFLAQTVRRKNLMILIMIMTLEIKQLMMLEVMMFMELSTFLFTMVMVVAERMDIRKDLVNLQIF